MEPASALASMHVSCTEAIFCVDFDLQSTPMLMGNTLERIIDALLCYV